MLWKRCIQYASIFGKFSSDHRTRKGQFSFQSQRKAMPKNAQILHNCSHLTCYQSNVQNSPRQASILMNGELPDVQAGFRKGRRTRDQTANTHSIIEGAREFQKNVYFFFIDYAKAFDSMGHYKLWKLLQETGKTDHLTCLLRNLYTGQ